MAALDKVMQLQSQGMQEADIVKKLRDEGVSPQEINDAINQAKVKTAVSQPEIYAQNQIQQPATPLQAQIPQQNQPSQQSQMPPPQTQEVQAPIQEMQQSIMQAPPAQEQAPIQPPQEQYYPQATQPYPEETYYPQESALSTDTITEVAEQVVSEKFADFRKKTGDLVAFKNQIQDQDSDIDERLRKIENAIEKLQQAIIGKIGEFGESTAAVHKDLENIHNTMSKLMNPLIDNYKELKKIAKK